MSDLSWLNPTPHAIAVHASQPLSPVATQHSLPSGRYSLLGPVFHRLDRTSFAWRTHSITSSARRLRGRSRRGRRLPLGNACGEGLPPKAHPSRMCFLFLAECPHHLIT